MSRYDHDTFRNDRPRQQRLSPTEVAENYKCNLSGIGPRLVDVDRLNQIADEARRVVADDPDNPKYRALRWAIARAEDV